MSEKPTILVVDDDLPILTLMRTLLREFGFDPVTAATGHEAISAARERPPSVVLLDLNMPGMAGAEVIRMLRAEFGPLPILILSGDPISRSDVASLGADGAVQKPFDVPALIATIKNVIPSSS